MPYSGGMAPALASSGGKAASSPIRRYLVFLLRKWWIILLSVLFFGGLAAAYVAWWPQSYMAAAHMWAAGRMGLQIREGMIAPEDNQTYAGTQIELLQSGMMLSRAYRKVHDTLHIDFPTNSDGNLELPVVKAGQLPKSAVLQLTAKGFSETSVVAFLNAVIDEYLAYKREIRSASSSDTYTLVSEQTLKQEAELKAEQEKLTAFMRENNVAVLQNEAVGASTYLTALLSQASELKLQTQVLDALSSQETAAPGQTNVPINPNELVKLAGTVVPNTTPAPEFLGSQQELEKLRIMRGRLSKYLRPEHPKIVKIDEQIAQAEKIVAFLSQQSRDQVAHLQQTTKLRLERVQEQIKEWEAKINNASERIAEYERRKLNVTRLQELHDHLLGLLQTVDVSKGLDQENINILDRPSRAKDAKKTLLVTALLLICGLGVGCGLVFLVEQTDDRVISAEDLERRFDEWVGNIPNVPRQRKKKRPDLIAVDDRRHIYVEAHRSMRSALWFAMSHEERPKIILVTSAVPKEGKSTVASNLARTMAFAGSRVLLIDADLRRGQLHELFDLPAEPGLGDLLSREGDLPFYLMPTSVPNLTLMPRGKHLDNTGELFLAPSCDRLLARVRKEFDCVIIDSIPIFAADDTTSLAPKVDGVLFVVRHSFTSADTARHALEMLYERQVKVLGIVFNRANPTARSYRYYKYGEYYHSAKKD